MLASLWSILVRLTLGASGAILLIVFLRPLARRLFGVSIAYALWALLPAVLMATFVPGPSANHLTAVTDSMLRSARQPIAHSLAVVASTGTRLEGLLLSIWVAGAMVMIAVATWRHRQYWRSLGRVTREGPGVLRAERAAGPAMTGILRPQLVLPADFEHAFSPGERALMLAHETIHRRRGDLPANALAECVRCLQWFNPIVHWAHGAFRRDQELACDALAATVDGDHRAKYAALLLKAQALSESSLSPPLGASWHPVHPLTERLVALRRKRPTAATSAVGKAAIALTLLSLTAGSWTIRAQTVAIAGGVPIALTINWTMTRASTGSAVDSGIEKRTLRTDAVVLAGQSMHVVQTDTSGKPRYDMTCKIRVRESGETAISSGQLLIQCMVRRQDGVPIAAPSVITADNEDAAVETSVVDDDGKPVLMHWTFNASTSDGRIKRAQAAAKPSTAG